MLPHPQYYRLTIKGVLQRSLQIHPWLNKPGLRQFDERAGTLLGLANRYGACVCAGVGQSRDLE